MIISHDLNTGEVTGKFESYTISLPKREDLAGKDLEDLAVSLLSEAIGDYVRDSSMENAAIRMQQGFKAVKQLTAWLEQYRGPDPTVCVECNQQL